MFTVQTVSPDGSLIIPVGTMDNSSMKTLTDGVQVSSKTELFHLTGLFGWQEKLWLCIRIRALHLSTAALDY